MVNIHIKKTFGPYQAGQVVKVVADTQGTPMDAYWRRRLADAVTDGCCELEQLQAPSKTKRRSKTAAPSNSED